MDLYKKTTEELVEIRKNSIRRMVEYRDCPEREKIKIFIKKLDKEIGDEQKN